MRIKIRKGASLFYIQRCYRNAHPECGMLHRPEWADMLKKVEGKWLEVETEYLFKDQFNTAPIPGVSELGMRIMIEDVEEIEDDIREGLSRCNFCGKHALNPSLDGPCSLCGQVGYLEPLLKNSKKY